MRVSGGPGGRGSSRLLRMTFWSILGMALLVQYGMTSPQETTEEIGADEQEECEKIMNVHERRVRNLNSGKFEIPSNTRPAKGYPNGADCFNGFMDSPSKLVKRKQVNADWDAMVKAKCHVDDVLAFDEQEINKALVQKNIGSQCESGTCIWDTSIRNTVCGEKINALVPETLEIHE